MAKKLKKIFHSRTEQLQDVRRFVTAAALQFGFSDDDVANIVLAVDEACSNVIRHAYKNAADKDITIFIEREKGKFEVTVIDQGSTFNPDDFKVPDIKKQLSEIRRGGLGMYLMKKLMDSVEYEFIPGKKNRVRMTKYLELQRT